MTRLWPEGQPIEVRCTTLKTPHVLVWQGQTHPVQGIAKRWRLDLDWWRGRTWREYFKLYTQTGLLVIIYRDLLTDQWYLQRLYD
jgi:hypothetical protein